MYLRHRARSARRSEGADGAGRHAQADGVQAKLRALVEPQEPETPAQSVAPAECEANCAHGPGPPGSAASDGLRGRCKRPEGKG